MEYVENYAQPQASVKEKTKGVQRRGILGGEDLRRRPFVFDRLRQAVRGFGIAVFLFGSSTCTGSRSVFALFVEHDHRLLPIESAKIANFRA